MISTYWKGFSPPGFATRYDRKRVERHGERFRTTGERFLLRNDLLRIVQRVILHRIVAGDDDMLAGRADFRFAVRA